MLSLMKSSAVIFLMLLSLALSIPCVHAGEMKIASVDVRKIFNEWEFATEVEGKLDEQRLAMERENNERRAVIAQYQMERNKMRQDFQVNRRSISFDEKAKLDRKFTELGRDAFALEQNRRDFYGKAKRNLDLEVSAQSKLILQRITEAVQVYALAEKYDMVIEMGGHTTRNLPLFLHLDNAEDITDIIIARLNESE